MKLLGQQIADILRQKSIGSQVVVQGWLRTRRDTGGVSFLELNDGSCLQSLQVVVDEGIVNYLSEIKKLTTGCSPARARRAGGFACQGAGC